MSHNNPTTLRRFHLEAQRDANTSEQADLRHKLLFSTYPYHQTPEGQKVISDLLDSSVRVGLQIRSQLAALEDSSPDLLPGSCWTQRSRDLVTKEA